MTLAEKLSLTGAFLFFLIGLLAGTWKYWHVARSDEGKAPVYVDVAHRAALLYAFAALLLSRFAALSLWPESVNIAAVLAPLAFFAGAIASYIVHGFLQDTDNQLRRPHRLGKGFISGAAIKLFMISLIIAELGGALVLGVGAGLRIWGFSPG
jgi:hypothetical protein